jgi:peptidoglycan/xylan/chitin deacetylase (PgdA/CDA1 family)
LVCAIVTAGALWQISRARCLTLVGNVTCRVETTKHLVALTFDDGPTRLGVNAVLPLLERYDARATFFLTGREVQQEPDLARRILDAGHEIGNHSYSHTRMVGRPRDFYDAELNSTQRTIAAVGSIPTAFRPPYGKKLWGLPKAVEHAGLAMVTWDVEDPATSNPTDYAREVLAKARPGSIILIHAMYPANQTARDALPIILQGLKDKKLQVVSYRQLRQAVTAP